MTARVSIPVSRILSAASALLIAVDQVHACAVCYGDPESSMAQGVVAGVLVLVGIVGAVLLTIACTGLRWIQRSRRIARQQSPAESALSGDLP